MTTSYDFKDDILKVSILGAEGPRIGGRENPRLFFLTSRVSLQSQFWFFHCVSLSLFTSTFQILLPLIIRKFEKYYFFLNIVKEFLNDAIFFIVLNKWLYQVLAAVISGRNQVIQFILLFLGSVKEISIRRQRGLFYRKKETSGSVTLTISSQTISLQAALYQFN